jgi:NADH dehydrogenase [ubiquinone] 1 alpha subcomplex assembly factor 7
MERHVEDGAFVEVATAGMGEHPDGTVLEQGEAARAVVATLAARVAAQGGAALFLDYGPERSGPGDSLQAVRGGKPADPLADPGGADLTAHVDFAALADAARHEGAAVHGPLPQGIFLAHLGLFQRSGMLARRNPARASALTAAAQRLAEPDQMGRLFKAIAVCHPGLPSPPGFTE